MPLVARASATVRNKNLIIVLMCAVFCGWFGYDGFVGYAAQNDRVVAAIPTMIENKRIDAEYLPKVLAWRGWKNESEASQIEMNEIAKNLEGWHKPFDFTVQRWIVYGLAVATAASIWWFFHCQRRRAIAEETTVSPAPGVVIPWGKITRIDNTRWKSAGIVEITYTDEQGNSKKSKFDDYETQREPLLSILDQLAEKAVNAEFIPKEDSPGAAPAEPAAEA